MNTHNLSATLAAFGIVAALIPTSGFAYITPSEAFTNPNMRDGSAIIEAQQALSAQNRDAAYAAQNPAPPEPAVTVVDTSPPKNLLDEKATYERRMERMEQEKSNGPTIIITGGGTVTDAQGKVLHSGAPRVTATGPESILAFAAILLAGISTYAYAGIRNRRIATLS